MPPKRYGDDEFYPAEEAIAADEPVETARSEKTPGVYTREPDSPHELDMLWSSGRLEHKEDRSPIVFFLVGFLLGGLITGLVVFLLVKQPDIKAGESEFVTTPVEKIKVEDTATEKSGGFLQNLFGSDTKKAEQPAETAEPKAETTAEEPKTEVKPEPVASSSSSSTPIRTYTVQNGDTLGAIAYRHYKSSAPKYVEKIQRANNLRSPDSLQIGQKLVIPNENI